MKTVSPRAQEQFNQLVKAHYKTMWSYAANLTRNKAATEDIVHQAFLAAFDWLARGNAFEGAPLAWLRATARNQACRVWRQQQRLASKSIDDLNDLVAECDDAADQAIRKETTDTLRQCMEKLDAGDRKLLGQAYEEGESPTSIAQVLQENVGTIRVRLFRIRKALKACLDRNLMVRGTA